MHSFLVLNGILDDKNGEQKSQSCLLLRKKEVKKEKLDIFSLKTVVKYRNVMLIPKIWSHQKMTNTFMMKDSLKSL